MTGYRRFAAATGLTTAGDGVFAAAVPLLAATLTRDPRLVSAVAAASSLPWLLFALPAGALADRYDRARMLWRGVAAQAALAVLVTGLTATGQLGVGGLAALAFGLGAGQVLTGTAAQALLPSLVSAGRLPSANGYQQTIAVVGQQFLGPPAGSLLFAVAAALPFGADAVVLAVAATLAATLRRAPRDQMARTPSSLRAEIVAALRWLAAHRALRTLTLLAAVNTFAFQLGNATLVLLATTEVGVTARGFGLLLATAAAGSLAGGLGGPWLLRRLGDRTVLLAALALNAAATAAIGLTRSAVALGLLLAGIGLGVTLWNLVSIGLRQRLVPPQLLGRVMGVHRLVGWGLVPAGALLSGVVAHAIGLRAPYPLAGAVRAAALVVALPALLTAFRDPG